MLKLRHEADDAPKHFQVYTGAVRTGTVRTGTILRRTQPKFDIDRRNSHNWERFPVFFGGRPWEFPYFRP
jgi:hypothetical protein